MPLRTKLGEGGPMAEQGGHLQRDKGHSCPLPVMERRARKPRPSAWAVQLLLPLLNSVTLSLGPNVVAQKVPKTHPKFLMPSTWLGHRPGQRGCPGFAVGALSPMCCLPARQRTASQYSSPSLACAPYSYFLDTNHTKFQHLETAK